MFSGSASGTVGFLVLFSLYNQRIASENQNSRNVNIENEGKLVSLEKSLFSGSDFGTVGLLVLFSPYNQRIASENKNSRKVDIENEGKLGSSEKDWFYL